jgi:membrane glycosyltransferase
LLLWMLPVIAGLVLAGPLNWLTSQRAGEAMSALLSTWDDRDPPSVLIRARELATDWQKRFSTAAVAAKQPANDSAQVKVPRAA